MCAVFFYCAISLALGVAFFSIVRFHWLQYLMRPVSHEYNGFLCTDMLTGSYLLIMLLCVNTCRLHSITESITETERKQSHLCESSCFLNYFMILSPKGYIGGYILSRNPCNSSVFIALSFQRACQSRIINWDNQTN